MSADVLQVEDLRVTFPVAGSRRGLVAVDGLSLRVTAGETLALVGESGCGKSTVARAVLGLQAAGGGRILFEGTDLTRLSKSAMRALRPRVQMVFQDPWAALNPRMRIGELIEEPLRFVAGFDPALRRARVRELVHEVDLDEAVLARQPPALSGGQLQRVCIARAIATSPALLVLDEPTSSLDLSVRGSVLALLERLQRRTGMAMLFISHDIGSVRRLAHRVTVLYLGREMESGPVDQVLDAPAHPYTRALLDAYLPPVPGRGTRRVRVTGELPSPLAPPDGCVFHPRCPDCETPCRVERPATLTVGPRSVACHVHHL
jgi:oligopeptide/dipeptide ABC transporter ATP-binding protein